MGFQMIVDDVFYIGGRGVVVTGKLERGDVSAGSRVVVERDGRQVHAVTVNAVEFASRKRMQDTTDSVGLLLRDLRKDDVATGDVLRDGE